MPKDLFETELGMKPVNQTMMPRDLLGEKPQRSFSQQVNDNISDNYGFTDDDKFIIKQVFTPEEIEEFKVQKPMGLLEGIKKKGFWSALAEQGSEFKRNFHPVDAFMSSGKMLVDYKAVKEITNFEPKSKEQIRKELEEFAKSYPQFEITDQMVEDKYNQQLPTAATYMRDVVRDMYKDQLRGTTVMGNVGNIMGEAPAFMSEIYVAGGAAGFGKPLIKQAAKEAFKKSLKASSKNIAKKAAKKGIQAAAITSEVGAMAAASPTMLEKNYLDRRIAGTIKATDKGEALISEMDESPYRTAAKAFMDTSVAIGSEMSGEAIMKGVGYVAGKAGKVLSPVLAKFTASPRVAKVRDAILREARKIKPDLDMQKFMHDKVYYNGVLGEMSEERLEGVMRAALQLNDDDERSTTDQILEAMFPESDQLLAELGAFSMMGSLPYASRVAKNFLKSKGLNEQQVEETIRNLPQTEIDKLTQQANDEAESKSGLDYLDVVRVPLYKIKLSKDIPNFKEGVNENGVVEGEQLQGEFDDLGTGPIVLWERTNGDLEVVTGRHRFDLAKRSGREDIAAQIVKESLGWDAKKVRQIDVEQNIRDDKGTIWDMARYFREDGMSLAEAVRKGLIRENAKSRAAIDIATKSSESLYSLFANKKIKADKAVAIAIGAPNNEAAQAAGIKAADKMSAEELQIYTSMLNEVAKTKGASESDGDLFGFDDSSIKEMEEISKNVAKDIKAIDNKISAVRGALRNPKIAEEMGLKFDVTPENISKEIIRLKEQKAALQKISTNPELMSQYRNELHKEGKEPPLRDAVYRGGRDNTIKAMESKKNIDSDIDELVDIVNEGKNRSEKREIGNVTEQLVNLAAESANLNLNGYTHNIDTSSIIHIRNNHGNPKVESKRGQIAVTKEDLKKIPQFIYDWDFIAFGGKNKRHQDVVIYGKNMPDGSSIYMEEIRTRQKTLTTNTLIKYKTGVNSNSFASRIGDNVQNDTSHIIIISKNDANVNSKNDVMRDEVYDAVPEEGGSIEPKSLGLSEDDSVEVKKIETTINTALEAADPFRKDAKQLGWWSGIYAGIRSALFGSDANASSFEDYQEGVWSKMRRAFTDYLSGLEKINTEAYKRARVNAGLGGRVIEALTDRLTRLDKEGNIEDLGEGFIPILKDFRAEFGVSMEETEKDLGDYLVARRYLEDLQNRDDVTVTDAQIEESVNKLDALKQKYGAQVIRLQEYADRIYDYQKRLSHLLVDTELITEEKYNEMLAKNQHYVPFYRILEDNGLETDNMVRQASSGGFNRANPTIKKIKGSELDIRNPFASIVNNTVNVLRNTEKNEVARSVAALKDQYPALVRDKEPLMEHGKVKMKVSFDRGLRDALKQGIELLGAKFEKVKTLNKRGMKGLVLGEYSPQEKTVRERLGVDNALTHEFGHLLDFDLNLGRWILDAETRVELEKLAEERLMQETEAVEDDNGNIRLERKRISEPPASHLEYIKNDRELIANLYDAYINAPELLDNIAPKAKKKLETAIEKSGYTWLKDIKRTLDKGVEDIEQDAWVKSRTMPSGNTISYYEKGKKKYIEVQNSLYKALNGLDKSRLPFVVRMLFVMPEQMLRRTTTMWSAAFTIRNMVRDTMEAAINTDVGFVPILSTLRGMYDVATKSDAYKQWMAAGGSFDSFMEVNENSDRNPYDELFGNMNKLQALNPLKWIEAFGTLGEQATRVSVYRLAKKRGLSDLDASILARGGTLDFARGGEWSKKANQFSAFLNASIQGVSAMAQAFKRKPVETTVKALAYITLPSILETGYYLYMASDDDREQYLELPSWRKELFWNFKVGNNWFMIPKPFTYGMVFGTIPQAVMIADYKNDKTDWKHLFEQTMGTMNPLQDTGTYLPKLIKEIIEQETNHDFFTDREIVPFYTLKQDEQYQYGDYTSEAAKKIGKAIGVSPARVEHAITSIFGTLSKDVLAASDLWKKEDEPEKEWGELPVVRGFVNLEPIGNRSQSVQDYYEMFNDAFGAQTTLNALKKKDYDEALEYEAENLERLNLYEALKPYERKRKAIMDEIDKIKYSPLYMSPKEKKEQISELQRELTANAREALKLKKNEKVLKATVADKVTEKLLNGKKPTKADEALVDEVVRLNMTQFKPVMTDVTERTNLKLVDDSLKPEVAEKYSKMYTKVANEIIKTEEYKKANNAGKKKLLDKVRSKVVQQLKKEYGLK